MNVQTIDISKRIAQYVALRDLIKKKKEQQKKELDPLQDTLEKLSGVLLAHLNAINSDTASVKGVGSVYKTTRKSASLADADAFMRFVIDNGLWELLDRKANAVACEEYAKEHNTMPPGVNFNTSVEVGVRRA